MNGTINYLMQLQILSQLKKKLTLTKRKKHFYLVVSGRPASLSLCIIHPISN